MSDLSVSPFDDSVHLLGAFPYGTHKLLLLDVSNFRFYAWIIWNHLCIQFSGYVSVLLRQRFVTFDTVASKLSVYQPSKPASSLTQAFITDKLLSESSYSFLNAGSRLASRTVSSPVLSAAHVLTVVFGMGTGVAHERIAAGNI